VRTAIEWTDETWNPVTGCDRVSPGCDNCYALTLAKRLKGMGQPKYQRDGDPRTSGPGFGLTVHPSAVNIPLRWRRPRKIFVNSMSDLFHKDVPDNWLADIFAVMATARQHTYQVLTKRHGRMRHLMNDGDFISQVLSRAIGKGLPPGEWAWPLPSVWLGVSVEDQDWARKRIGALQATPAAVRWISAEPLLAHVDLSPWLPRPFERDQCGYWLDEHLPEKRRFFSGPSIGWVVAGGESGPGARPFDLDWARSLRDQCAAARVPFLFKQVGGRWPKANGRMLDGRTHDDYPTAADAAPNVYGGDR
jgi:protein gp37